MWYCLQFGFGKMVVLSLGVVDMASCGDACNREDMADNQGKRCLHRTRSYMCLKLGFKIRVRNHLNKYFKS